MDVRLLSHTHMDQLLLRVVLLAAALPVAVGLVDGLGLLLTVVPVHVVLQVQQAAVMVLWIKPKSDTWIFSKYILDQLSRSRVCLQRAHVEEFTGCSAAVCSCFT